VTRIPDHLINRIVELLPWNLIPELCQGPQYKEGSKLWACLSLR
jgi:hypothetical protein